MVSRRDNRDDIRALLFSSYTTITWWGVLLIYTILVGRALKIIGPFGHQCPRPVRLLTVRIALRISPKKRWALAKFFQL